MAKKKKEEETAPEEANDKNKSGGGTMKMILMIGVPLMLVQAVIAWFLISSFAQPTKAVSAVEEETVQEDSTEPGILFEFADVIVNPAGTAGSRFLNATVVLEFTNSKLESEINEKNVQLRDALVNVLISKTIFELDGAQARANIKEEIKETCNSILKVGKIRMVYLPSFIFQ
ncbi:MAG: hypothetical protein DWQ05_14055 [Calditrichaeota bacterium]|nr:MAG: hypothetical protein DWQ05_14055 [Calditrichota bacterium]